MRTYVQTFLAGYVQHKTILSDINNYIVLPGLGSESGICGALQLAIDGQKER